MLIAAVVLLAACGKKSDSGSGPTLSAAAKLLTASPWNGSKNEWRTTAGAWVAPPSFATFPYYPGATVTFLSSGAYSTNGGAAGTWQLSSGDATLTIFLGTGSSRTLTIGTLTSATLQFTQALNPDDSYTVNANGSGYTHYDMSRTTLTR
ncbi:hypothetical protein [Mucilaginibacter flavus]|uniref:hypothetical protein n=1 Tax=Mucilaginibacter flavus TaxID=931504 RepID=UPI0025B5F6ED|nr:hypothetical protein [Mucilaginibacter flavus]